MGEGIFCGQLDIVLDNIDSWKAISRHTRNWPAIHQNSPTSLCLARQQEQTIIPHLPNEKFPLFRKKPITSLNNNQKNLCFLPEQQVKQKYISFPGKGYCWAHLLQFPGMQTTKINPLLPYQDTPHGTNTPK